MLVIHLLYYFYLHNVYTNNNNCTIYISTKQYALILLFKVQIKLHLYDVYFKKMLTKI